MEHVHPSGSLWSVWLLSYIWDRGYIPLHCLVHSPPYQLRGSLGTHLFLPSERQLFTPRVRSEPVSFHLFSSSSLPPGKPFWLQATTGFIQSQQVTTFHDSSSITHDRQGHSITLISYLTSTWLCPSKTSQHGMWRLNRLREGATSGSYTWIRRQQPYKGRASFALLETYN